HFPQGEGQGRGCLFFLPHHHGVSCFGRSAGLPVTFSASNRHTRFLQPSASLPTCPASPGNIFRAMVISLTCASAATIPFFCLCNLSRTRKRPLGTRTSSPVMLPTARAVLSSTSIPSLVK